MEVAPERGQDTAGSGELRRLRIAARRAGYQERLADEGGERVQVALLTLVVGEADQRQVQDLRHSPYQVIGANLVAGRERPGHHIRDEEPAHSLNAVQVAGEPCRIGPG